MALTEEQVKQLKDQLKEQVKNLPPGQKEQALGQIEAMSNEAIEEMLKHQQSGQEGQKGIFRMIVDGEVPSKKIDENDFAIAVVSKRAITKGHVLLIPKKAIINEKEMPESVNDLAKNLAKRMKTKLKAKEIARENTKAFGEIIIDLIPDYGAGIDRSKAYESSDEEMQEIHDKLWIAKKKKRKVVKLEKKAVNQGKPLKLKRHVP